MKVRAAALALALLSIASPALAGPRYIDHLLLHGGRYPHASVPRTDPLAKAATKAARQILGKPASRVYDSVVIGRTRFWLLGACKSSDKMISVLVESQADGSLHVDPLTETGCNTLPR